MTFPSSPHARDIWCSHSQRTQHHKTRYSDVSQLNTNILRLIYGHQLRMSSFFGCVALRRWCAGENANEANRKRKLHSFSPTKTVDERYKRSSECFKCLLSVRFLWESSSLAQLKQKMEWKRLWQIENPVLSRTKLFVHVLGFFIFMEIFQMRIIKRFF